MNISRDGVMYRTFFFTHVVTAHHCGRGWVSFEKNCYYFSTSAVTFNDAMVRLYHFQIVYFEPHDR